mmetsp:Transcript_41751/g.111299  ORF Transcript_41751/g.111299 Transcript_41751/m.111299 type:complete len:109 (+) Transcript_41751:1-327(+)
MVMLQQLLASGPFTLPPAFPQPACPLRNPSGTSIPVLFTEFDDGDLGNLTNFLRSNVIPYTPRPHCEELVRGRNPFRSLSTRQVMCSVNEVAFNNGTWLVLRPGGWQA